MGVLEPGKYMCSTLHPTVMAKINGIDARIMMDSGASSSYICTELLTKLRMKPKRYENKIIEQMYGTVHKKVERYNVKLTSSAFSNFAVNVDCINAGKDVLTYIVNPNIHHLKKKHPRLSHLRFSEENAVGVVLPVHVILGVADYQRIKTTEPPVLGKNTDKDPGTELTMLGWMIQGGINTHTSDLERNFFLNSGVEEFSKLCSLEVLGIADEAPSKENEFLSSTPLQPLLFDVLLRNRMKEFCLTGDVKQAFLQIEVDPIDRDAQRLLWYKDLETRETAMYRFTRVMFGSVSSPIILGATLRKHVSEYMDVYPQTAQELLENTYVDDIQFGSDDKQDLYKFKRESSELLETAGFALHKWHSNVVELIVRLVTF
ncbi:hypothetical protein QZH41_010985 [Actinostola sp. cb2023]|nr:hypothetical protein QZH41_010985 [Actinostola sp. cb2023]